MRSIDLDAHGCFIHNINAPAGMKARGCFSQHHTYPAVQQTVRLACSIADRHAQNDTILTEFLHPDVQRLHNGVTADRIQIGSSYPFFFSRLDHFFLGHFQDQRFFIGT